MARITTLLPSALGVAAGGTAVFNLPIGLTYHDLFLNVDTGESTGSATNNVWKVFKEWRLKVDGRIMSDFTGDELRSILAYHGISGIPAAQGASGVIRFPFDRLGLRSKAGAIVSALGTGVPPTEDFPYTPATVTVECDIAPSTDDNTFVPVLSGVSSQSIPSPFGSIIKRRRFARAATGAGVLEVADLPRGDYIDKIYIFEGVADNITRAVIERNNRVIFDRTRTINDAIQSAGYGRTGQDNLFVIDPAEEGYGDEALPTVANDFRLKLTCGAADAGMVIVVDYLGGIGGN